MQHAALQSNDKDNFLFGELFLTLGIKPRALGMLGWSLHSKLPQPPEFGDIWLWIPSL